MIDSDRDSKSETHGASTEEWVEDNILQKLEDFAGVSAVTTECNNPQSIREITINFWQARIKITGHSIGLCKNSLVNNELRISWLWNRLGVRVTAWDSPFTGSVTLGKYF